MNNLITDMIWEIMLKLSYKDRRILASINKHLSSFYKAKKLNSTKIAGVDVYFGKKELLEEILINKNRIISVNAPPSWGKSLFSLLIPFHIYPLGTLVENHYERFIIAIPQKLITMYKNEILKKLPNAINIKNPENSAIIIEDKCIGTHYNYCHPKDSNKLASLSNHNRVIITPHLHAGAVFSTIFSRIISSNMSIIVDEAHIGKTSEIILNRYKNRIILLSATPITFNIASNFYSYTIPRDDIVDLLPYINFHSSQKSLEELIERNLTKRSKLLIICNDVKAINLLVKNYLDEIYKDKDKPNVYKFTNSIQKINQFEKYEGKAILIAEYAKISVGFSILADCAILNECEHIGYERLYQIVSRLLRITNKNKKIFTTVRFGDGDTFFMRVKKAAVTLKCKYDITIPKSYFELNTRVQTLHILDKLNIKYKDLSDAELLMAIAPNCKALEQMFINYALIDCQLRKDILYHLFY